jgi:hypothetical protein
MSKLDEILTKMREKEDKTGKFLQLVVLTTKEGVSYEFFGTPIDISRIDSDLKGVMFGPTIEKEGAIEYLRSGSKYLFEGKDGEGAWEVGHGPWPGDY